MKNQAMSDECHEGGESWPVSAIHLMQCRQVEVTTVLGHNWRLQKN